MKKIILIGLSIIMFFFKSSVLANYEKIFYDFNIEGISGEVIDFKEYKGKAVLIVNTASYCGFTNQYEDLQNIWSNYKEKDLVVVGIPTNNFRQEPGSNKEIKDFCETNFNINFPMSEKLDVIGNNAHPFYKWAKKNYGKGAIPKWNFHKIIIGKDGKVVTTFSSITRPSSKKFINTIEKLI